MQALLYKAIKKSSGIITLKLNLVFIFWVDVC